MRQRAGIHDPEADAAFVEALRASVPERVAIIERDSISTIRPSLPRPPRTVHSDAGEGQLTMALRYSRQAFLARLRGEIAAGRALVMTGAGNGIAAKFIERGGVDILGVYNTGYFRMQGYGSLAGMLPIADANELVFRTAQREVLPQVQADPVVAGVNGVDPLRDMPRFLSELARSAFPAFITSRPSPGSTASFAAPSKLPAWATCMKLQCSNGARAGPADRRVCVQRRGHRPADGRSGPDIYIFHAGITAGGTTGDAARLPRRNRRAEPAALRPGA